jgi:Uncharacterized conserved protein
MNNRTPLFFVGHGSPMIALEENDLVTQFRAIPDYITKPDGIICISAHWETEGSYVTAMEHPRTIHDFGGFPKELYEIQYPAPGSPGLCNEILQKLPGYTIGKDQRWGLDHGTWSVLRHIYPHADIPIVQLSLDYTKPAQYHYELSRELASFRRSNILIIGSGNMVHNLRMVDWRRMDYANSGYEWAVDAKETMKRLIMENEHLPLIQYDSQNEDFRRSIPTPEHFLPLLYILALQEPDEKAQVFNDLMIGGSVSMLSLKIG